MPYFPPAGGNVLLPNSVSDDYLADMPAGTIKGRLAGSGTGDPQNLTTLQVLRDLAIPFTQCRLVYVSADYIRLDRFNGCLLTIDNKPEVIPEAGVTLHRGGMGPNGFYYIYAYMNAGVMTLENSTNPLVGDSRNGIAVMNVNPSRTCVGAVQADASGLFVYSTVSRAVASYYNRRLVYAEHNGMNSTGSGTTVPLDTVYLLTIDSAVEVKFSGAFNVNGDQTIWAFLLWNGVSLSGDVVSQNGYGWANATMVRQVVPAPGLHYYQVAGKVSGATGTWSGMLSAQALM